MLLFKRLLTSFVLCLILWVALSIATLAFFGGMSSGRPEVGAKATDYTSGYDAGYAAGQELGKKYGRAVLLITLGVSAVASISISFTGVLPWCRKKPRPPLLPEV